MHQQPIAERERAENTGNNNSNHDEQSEKARNSSVYTHNDRRSIAATMFSTLLLRVSNRSSFVLLSFYLGAHFASATIVAVVLEAFYISELLLAPIVGGLSDRLGRKPFIFAAPILGGGANLCLLGSALLFPHPDATTFNLQLVILLLLILAGRLLEGTTTALSTPASLGYISDISNRSERLKVRIMTAFELTTIGGIALGVPFGGKLSTLGTWGFLVVIGLHLLNIGMIAFFVKESTQRTARTEKHPALFVSLQMLREKHIFTFLPAWLSINALVGSWMSLILLTLTYPDAAADLRHPGQFLYGGFAKGLATKLMGGFGLIFLVGMGLWMLVLPRLRRTTVMLIGLVGLGTCVVMLSIINRQAEPAENLTGNANMTILLLLPFVILGVLLLSGFTPAALLQMATIAETRPEKRGAIMGLYSVVLAVGQLVGTIVGGMAIDLGGFYGLMVFSAVLGLFALGSVCYMRRHNHDLIKVNQQRKDSHLCV